MMRSPFGYRSIRLTIAFCALLPVFACRGFLTTALIDSTHHHSETSYVFNSVHGHALGDRIALDIDYKAQGDELPPARTARLYYPPFRSDEYGPYFYDGPPVEARRFGDVISWDDQRRIRDFTPWTDSDLAPPGFEATGGNESESKEVYVEPAERTGNGFVAVPFGYMVDQARAVHVLILPSSRLREGPEQTDGQWRLIFLPLAACADVVYTPLYYLLWVTFGHAT